MLFLVFSGVINLGFGYITETQDVAVILTSIYNLLLTMFYFKIIDTGRQIIVRNFRKGQTNGGFIK